MLREKVNVANTAEVLYRSDCWIKFMFLSVCIMWRVRRERERWQKTVLYKQIAAIFTEVPEAAQVTHRCHHRSCWQKPWRIFTGRWQSLSLITTIQLAVSELFPLLSSSHRWQIASSDQNLLNWYFFQHGKSRFLSTRTVNFFFVCLFVCLFFVVVVVVVFIRAFYT